MMRYFQKLRNDFKWKTDPVDRKTIIELNHADSSGSSKENDSSSKQQLCV